MAALASWHVGDACARQLDGVVDDGRVDHHLLSTMTLQFTHALVAKLKVSAVSLGVMDTGS